jgi:hypothetical protein
MNDESPVQELNDFIANFLEKNPEKIREILENLIINYVKIYLVTRTEPSLDESLSLVEDCYGFYEEILNLKRQLK